MFLSVVLCLMCLPLNALAYPGDWDDGSDDLTVSTVWHKVSDLEVGGHTMSYSDFHNTFTADTRKFFDYAMNGVTLDGVSYGGLTNGASGSTTFILENIAKYGVAMLWADYNQVAVGKGDQRYNLFRNDVDNYSVGDSAWPQASEDLNTLLNELTKYELFKNEKTVWGDTNAANTVRIGDCVTYFGSSYGLNQAVGPAPGTGGFGYLVSPITGLYIPCNIMNIIALDVFEDDPDGLAALNGKNLREVSEAIVAKLNSSQPTTQTEVSNGEVTTTVVDTWQYPTTFNMSTSYIYGDSVAWTLAKEQGWITGDNGDEDNPQASVSQPGYYLGITANHAVVSQEYQVPDGITDVYILCGPLHFAASSSEPVSIDSMRTVLGDASNPSISDGREITVNICTMPNITNGDGGDWVGEYNSILPTIVNELKASAPSNVHIRLLDISSATVSGDVNNITSDIFSVLTSAVASSGSIGGVDYDGNSVILPSSVGETGLTNAMLIDLYTRNKADLQVYFRAYHGIITYMDTLSNIYFEDDPNNAGKSDDTKLEAYTRFASVVKDYRSGNDLFNDLYEQAFKPTDNLASIEGMGTGPAEPGGNPDDYVDAAKSALSLISDCDFNTSDYEITCSGDPENPKLNIIGYTALAAGAIYDPFVSTEGNAAYIAVIKDALLSANASEDKLPQIERFLQQALSRKKPLYVIDGKRDQWVDSASVSTAPTGDYRFAYVADLLQGDVNQTRCYCVMKGGMLPSTVDSNTWLYSQGTVTREQSNTEAGEGTNGEGEGRTDDEVRYDTNSIGTPAGSSVTATATEMSAPVMFTSGTTEGVWTGNWDGSADGYAASLGGLTTVIIHNAAQDAKDNAYIQHPEQYMLFMNGLGDVVLADGTIVLPAIANPAIYAYEDIHYSVDGSTSLGEIIGGALGGVAGVALGVFIVGAIGLTGGAVVPVILGVGGAFGVGGVAAGGAVEGCIIQNVEDAFWSESDSPEVIASYDGVHAYYPYTAAFMNHYPSTLINVEGKLAVLNSNDKGKYVIGIDDHGDILARKITGFSGKTQANLEYSGGGITVAPSQALSFNVESDTTRIGTMLPYYGGEDGTLGTKFNTAVKFAFYMCKNTAYNSDDAPFFPLQSEEDVESESYLNRAGPIMTSAKRFLIARHPTAETSEAFTGFNAKKYIMDMAGQCLMGTMYSETLQKNYQISYDELVEDTGNRLLSMLVDIVESAVSTLGKIDGVLAVKNGYENKFFNMIVSFIQEFYLLIVVVLLIIVAVKFVRGHYNLLFVCFIGLMCFCGFEVYANWMPTMIPAAYNFAVNDSVEHIVWNTMAVSAEQYAETYRDSSRKDATTGAPKPYTATLTLYKMTRQDMMDMAGRLNTTYKNLKSGEIHYLDETAGIFVQGDSIKISIDKLLVNNSMRGMYQSQWEELAGDFAASDEFITPVTREDDMIGNPYTIQITNPYVSLEAYYMPYNEIERAFLININKFASVFRLERNTRSYGKNLYKDCFVFNCFTGSGIFTAPGDKTVLQENIRIGSIVSRYANAEEAMQHFLARVYGAEGMEGLFPVPQDWLNAAAVFRSPSENFKDSIWGKAMQNKGWYDSDWNITNPDKLNDLIYYMNTQTKQFVIANSDQLNFLSDENAIKLVSLYATTTFTHYVSEFGAWLYPNYVNAADISLEDALYGSMTTLKDRNFAYDGTVVNTVANSLGIFGVIFLLLIVVFSTVFVFTITYLVPILYAMFGAVIIFKLINNSNSVGMVKGYVKVTGVTCLLYFIFSLSMRLVEVGGYAWYGYLGCALIMFLCCYFLFWVVLSVVQNIGEMGNDVLGQNLLRGIDHITRGAVRKLTTNTLYSRRGIRGYGGSGSLLPFAGMNRYGRGYGVDSFDYVRGSRRGMFGGLGNYARNSSYDYVERGGFGGSRVNPFGGINRFIHQRNERGAARSNWDRSNYRRRF